MAFVRPTSNPYVSKLLRGGETEYRNTYGMTSNTFFRDDAVLCGLYLYLKAEQARFYRTALPHYTAPYPEQPSCGPQTPRVTPVSTIDWPSLWQTQIKSNSDRSYSRKQADYWRTFGTMLCLDSEVMTTWFRKATAVQHAVRGSHTTRLTLQQAPRSIFIHNIIQAYVVLLTAPHTFHARHTRKFNLTSRYRPPWQLELK